MKHLQDIKKKVIAIMKLYELILQITHSYILNRKLAIANLSKKKSVGVCLG